MPVPKKPEALERESPPHGQDVARPRSEEPGLGADPADFDEDDEVGPQGGYGGTGPDQSRPKR